MAGVEKLLPVPIDVPPNGTLYQLYVPPAPVAVKFVTPPSKTVAVVGLAVGALGELFIVINCAPEKV